MFITNHFYRNSLSICSESSLFIIQSPMAATKLILHTEQKVLMSLYSCSELVDLKRSLLTESVTLTSVAALNINKASPGSGPVLRKESPSSPIATSWRSS